MPTDQHELLTAQEVAKRLRVTPSTVYRWASTGELNAITIGSTVRFRRDDIEARERGAA